MKGRDRFTGDETAWIREQLALLRVVERDEQKRIRTSLRRTGFYASDWSTDSRGLTVSDFDESLNARRIISDDRAGSVTGCNEDGSDDAWIRRTLPGALGAMAGPRHRISEALADQIPNTAGLYAIFGTADTWRRLSLGDPPDDRPLYVGKAEQNLVSRVLDTHFATGTTGHSSPRRSFAALLTQQPGLIAMPRRPSNPEPDKWTHYALEPESDASLTAWMRHDLTLAVWPCRQPVSLLGVERAVLHHWQPPLNLTGVTQPWRHQVRAARDAMTLAAKGWTP